jgi:hypothetical protein
MFIALRKSTVIFLAILQLIAPLVHAHTRENVLNQGLHVPGLEMYGVEQAVPVSQAVNDDRIGTRPIAGIMMSMDGGIIVGVDAGIKNKQIIAGLDDGQYLHQQAPVYNSAISPFDTGVSSQSQQFVCRLLIPSLSPRAPPAQ